MNIWCVNSQWIRGRAIAMFLKISWPTDSYEKITFVLF